MLELEGLVKNFFLTTDNRRIFFSGTIVAIENVLETLMSGKEVSIYNVVIRMRQERAHSVQRESVSFCSSVRHTACTVVCPVYH